MTPKLERSFERPSANRGRQAIGILARASVPKKAGHPHSKSRRVPFQPVSKLESCPVPRLLPAHSLKGRLSESHRTSRGPGRAKDSEVVVLQGRVGPAHPCSDLLN